MNYILTNEEKYISFSREVIVHKYEKERKEKLKEHELRFIASFKLMASSLDVLSKNLQRSMKELK